MIPAVCTLASVILAFALVELDRNLGKDGTRLIWIFRGGADSARAVLSTIAGSMITVAGTVYSITIVALTLASMQFAPRVLGRFMRDRSNQIVLGFFVATFTYCLLVLRTVEGVGDREFVPGTAVAGGLILALISLGMLIYFIDHIFHGIQVSNIIEAVSNNTLDQINTLYPDPWNEEPHTPIVPEVPAAGWSPVAAMQSGYLQYIDYDALLDLAVQADLVIREDRLVGSFIIERTPLALIHPAERLTTSIQEQINELFVLGSQPTMQQDIAFGIRQIVDISIKAISPAVNDPTTAINCIDHLGVILATLVTRKTPDLDRVDASGKLRIIVHERSFHDYARLAFDQLRHYGAGDPVIVIRLLDTIKQVAAITSNPAYREVLQRQVENIAAASEHDLVDKYEIDVVQARIRGARQALKMDE